VTVVNRAESELASFARLARKPPPGGFALPGALLAVLLIAALIAGAFSATTEETRIGAAAADRQRALVSAESAIEIAVTTLSDSAGSIGVGETTRRSIDGLGVPAVVYVTRLDSALYWLVADAGGIAEGSGVARRIGVVVRATRDSSRSITIDRIRERGWSELF
jgi:Tfp pilus assembly protein PilX